MRIINFKVEGEIETADEGAFNTAFLPCVFNLMMKEHLHDRFNTAFLQCVFKSIVCSACPLKMHATLRIRI